MVGIQDYWTQYQATRDGSSRDRLTLHYAPLVKFVAGRSAGGQAATAVALEALVGAIETYDGAGRFEPFAMQRMNDAVGTWEDGDDVGARRDVPVW